MVCKDGIILGTEKIVHNKMMVSGTDKRAYNITKGMALIDGDTIHFGDEVVHRLALMSTHSWWFNRLNAALFTSPAVSRFLYPVLRSGRRLALTLLGRPKIGH